MTKPKITVKHILTQKEQDCLALIGEEFSTRRAAEFQGVTYLTMLKRIDNIQEKLGLKYKGSRALLVRQAIKLGLVQCEITI